MMPHGDESRLYMGCQRFENKVVVVTGAGSGIGRATALLFGQERAKVAVVDLNGPAAEAVASEIRATGGHAVELGANVSVESEVVRTIQETECRWGSVHILVNNAASFVQKGVDASVNDWEATWRTNLLGAALCARQAFPLMRLSGGGVIINVASVSGMAGELNYATYNTSKAALLNLTQCLAVDLGPYGIRVNAVSPGATLTPALRAAVEREGLMFDTFEKMMLDRQCIRRLCQPEDVAEAIAFLSSDEAGCISGVNLVVDAGYMAKK